MREPSSIVNTQSKIRNVRKIASLLVLGFVGVSTMLSFQNCTGSFSSNLSSVASSSLAHPASARDANSALGSSTQLVVDNYVEVRSQPNQYYYNYAPDVVYFNGMYHMYWCAGVGAAGDYVLHAQSPNSYGPFHASNNATNFTYDVSLSPTLNSANFDGYETCDPSVMQVNGTFYLYYGGLATQSNSTATTKIGVATSSDGIHFSRANGGQPIVTPVSGAFNTYGAGQPAVFYIAPYYYMSFTDSTGSGGNGQYMIRALDPLFQSGEQELIGAGNWAGRSGLSRSGQYMWLGAFSIDIAYDALSGKLFVPSDQEEGITRLYIVDPTTFSNLGYLSINGTWADGASIAKNPDRTMLARASCSSAIDVNLFKGDSPSGNYTTVPLGTDWNISRSEASIQLSSNLCSTPAPVATVAAPAPVAFTPSSSAVFGINSASQIYQSNGAGGWNQIPGALSTISVGSDGALWGMNSAAQIFQYNGSGGWNYIPGWLTSLSVGNAQAVWGLNGYGQIFHFANGGWNNVPGWLTQISVGGDGSVWGLNGNGQIYQYNGAGGWNYVAGWLTTIAVGNANSVWGINGNGDIFQYNGSGGWNHIDGKLSQISVGANGSVWGINSGSQIFQYNGAGGWNWIPGALSQLTVGADGSVWGINSAQQIFQYNGSGGWNWIPGALSQIAN